MCRFFCAFLLMFFLLLGCKTIERSAEPVETIQAPVIFTHFKPSNTQPTTATAINESPDEQLKIKTVDKTPSKSTSKTVLNQRHEDLWQHIANNLQFKIYLNKALKKRIKWYVKQPHYLKTVNKRAAPYLYHIVRKVEQQNLPMEIALLPFVESDFRPSIRSSQHAVGVWQLVGATAHHFGVKSDQWYDGRQDVLASTDAALAYLKYLHKRFNGNWLHALAAYNTGEGRVKRAISENKKHGKSTDYWSLDLPKETAEYVPKLLALSYLVQNPNKGLKRPKLANKAITTEFDVGQQFDFSVIANLSGVGRKQLHKLNSGYLKNQSSPNGPHTLLIPMAQQSLLNSQFFKRNFAGEYIVKQGDTLYAIARRFDTSVKKLKMMNNKSSSLINIGETLIVGQPQTMPGSLTIDYKISPYLEHTEVAIPTIAVEYQVKPGDTIWGISQLYDVPHKDLAQWNQLSASSILKPGTLLVLHLPQAIKPTPPKRGEGMLSGLEKTLNKPQ